MRWLELIWSPMWNQSGQEEGPKEFAKLGSFWMVESTTEICLDETHFCRHFSIMVEELDMLHMFTTYWNGEMLNPIWFSTMRQQLFCTTFSSWASITSISHPVGKWSATALVLLPLENPMSCSRTLWRPDSPAKHARNSGPPRRASQLCFCCPHLFSLRRNLRKRTSDRKMMKGFSSNSSWIVVLRFLYLLHFSKKTQGPIVPHFEFSWLKTKVTYVFFVSEVTL